MESSLTVDGGGKPPPTVPPGYDNHFVNPPVKGVDNMQRHVNLLCGVIARDARPISFPQGDGFTNYLNGLNPELKPPDPKTIVETLKAMKLKRQMVVGEALRKTRSTKVGRLLNLPTNMQLDYLPVNQRQQYQLPVPFQHNSWSCDGWKRRNSASHYLSVCAHSLTHDFQLNNRLIMFREFPHRSLSVNLAAALDTCMVEMGLENYKEGKEVVIGDGEGEEKEGEKADDADEEDEDDEEEEEEEEAGEKKSFFQAAVFDGANDIQKAGRIMQNKAPHVHKCTIHTLQRVIIMAVKNTKVNEKGPTNHWCTVLPVKRLLKKANALVKLCLHTHR